MNISANTTSTPSFTGAKIWLVSIFFIALTGCASTSVFTPYPSQVQSAKSALGNNAESESVLKNLESKKDTADAMLYMMESSRVAQLSEQFERSKNNANQVINAFEKQDLQATVRLSDVGAKSGSLLTNENAIPYSGAGYERIFIHHQQALNYWAQNDIEGASVEFRKVALEQRVLSERYEDEIAKAHSEAQQNNIDIASISQEFSGLDEIAGSVKSSFLSPYTYYTSAAFWEAIGEYNNALIDYKLALEIVPNSQSIQADIRRVSAQLGGSSSGETNSPKDNEGSIVILYEQGFIPERTEFALSIPNFYDGGIISVAFPFYANTESWSRPTLLSIRDDQFVDYGETFPLTDYGTLAVKNLKEQLPSLIVRQVLRGFAKHELQKQSADSGGALGLFVANIYSIISERADLRSWLTLPRSGQALRVNLPSGQRTLAFRTESKSVELDVDIRKGKTNFIRIVNVNNRLITQVLPL
ncbi:MAG: hypothetical protein MK096_14125 [Oleiphilaceae bacterium]|nr:hypothetical protein [Oleiphilaceae bacterium]